MLGRLTVIVLLDKIMFGIIFEIDDKLMLEKRLNRPNLLLDPLYNPPLRKRVAKKLDGLMRIKLELTMETFASLVN